MFDPERILGALVRQGMRGSRRGGGISRGLISSGVGMGVLAVAVEAFDHYSKKDAQPSNPGNTPPPPPPPPPPPADIAEQEITHPEAMLLIRAMIAAANADGVIDADERNTILEQLRGSGISAEDQAYVVHEFFNPLSIADLAAGVASPAQAEMVYAVSLAAISVDTPAEEAYLQSLARALGLGDTQVTALHQAQTR